MFTIIDQSNGTPDEQNVFDIIARFSAVETQDQVEAAIILTELAGYPDSKSGRKFLEDLAEKAVHSRQHLYIWWGLTACLVKIAIVDPRFSLPLLDRLCHLGCWGDEATVIYIVESGMGDAITAWEAGGSPELARNILRAFDGVNGRLIPFRQRALQAVRKYFF